VPRKQHTAADTLSRRLRHPNNIGIDKEEDINDWILTKLGAYKICLVEIVNDLKEDLTTIKEDLIL
jgi:hypothetical protein